jgi:diaminohydroxyphosphoribosylaminopyrimidine deaminase / 5-amino-6-(5-phosphoribosylamino)uracil reductase
VTVPPDWSAPMREALALAQAPDAPRGVNPRVGCVIVTEAGEVVGRGYHRGAGTPHAEVVALADAGARARGATAVVTLEPCRHTGRTGPCTRALLEAGIGHVVFAQQDPTPEARGGAAELRSHGVDVEGGVLAADAERVNEDWTFAARTGRPLVTWKSAVSLDGRVAGADGGPTAITGGPARVRVHELRARVDAIVVGTGTVLADDPALTVRLPERDPFTPPLRVVVGSRRLPADSKVLDDSAPTLVLDERDPRTVLRILFERDVRHVLLEGGPTLAAAFLEARCIDRLEWYVAPLLLGAGPVALPAATSPALVGVAVEEVLVIGEDVCMAGRVRYEESES